MFWENIFCKRCGLIKEYNALDEEYAEFIKKNNEKIKKSNEIYKKYKEQIIEIRQLKDNEKIKDNEIIELKQKIKKLKDDEFSNILTITGFIYKNDYLEDEIFDLKELLGQKHSDWHIERNIAWRYDVNKLKPEKYEIPINFDVGKVKIIDFNDAFQMVSFKHEDDFGEEKYYEIPISLYDLLGGKLFKSVKEKTKNLQGSKDLTNDEIKKILISKGWNLRGKYIGKIINFMKEYWEKTFLTKDFNDYCGFNNRETRRQHLKKLIISGLVKKVKNGVYEFIPLET